MTSRKLELPRLTLEQKWKTAEGNLIYFVVSGIVFAKSKGASPEDFGICAGNVAAPYWQQYRGQGPQALVLGISRNKQQFRDFQLEILSESDTVIEARMKGFGEDDVREYSNLGVTMDDYVHFFEKKWEIIAESLGLEYKQEAAGEWTVFTVREKA
jgi:hypothetical protein